MLAERRGGSSGGADLVDEPVVERFPGVEVQPAPHVLGDLLGRPARKLGEASVEPPEQVLLLATVRGDRRRPGREVGIAPAGDQHDAPLEQLLLQPSGESAETGRLVGDIAPHAHSLSVQETLRHWRSRRTARNAICSGSRESAAGQGGEASVQLATSFCKRDTGLASKSQSLERDLQRTSLTTKSRWGHQMFGLMFYAPGLRNVQKFFKHGVAFLV